MLFCVGEVGVWGWVGVCVLVCEMKLFGSTPEAGMVGCCDWAGVPAVDCVGVGSLGQSMGIAL